MACSIVTDDGIYNGEWTEVGVVGMVVKAEGPVVLTRSGLRQVSGESLTRRLFKGQACTCHIK